MSQHCFSHLLLGGAYRESLGDHFSLLVLFVFQYSPTLHIRDFHVRYYRTPPFYWECTVSVRIMTLYSVVVPCVFPPSFLFIPHAYFLRIFPLYPCVHPDVLHHPSPYVWRVLYLEVHIYLESYICLEGSSLVY